jgi:hypothetical protein
MWEAGVLLLSYFYLIDVLHEFVFVREGIVYVRHLITW